MDEEDFNLKDLINAKEAFRPKVRNRTEPPIDKLVSEVVGKPIRVNNSKLIAKIVEWKQEKGDSEEPDNFLEDPEKVEELKKIL